MNDLDLAKLQKVAAQERRRQREAAKRAQRAELDSLRANIGEAGGLLGDAGRHLTTRAAHVGGVIAREADPAIRGILVGAAIVFAWPVIATAYAVHVLGRGRAQI